MPRGGSVGAAGGLGVFLPPLVMGFVYGRTGSYGIGLALLSVVAVTTVVLTLTVVRRGDQPRPRSRPGRAQRRRVAPAVG